jgi:hypothetical protein
MRQWLSFVFVASLHTASSFLRRQLLLLLLRAARRVIGLAT